MHLLSRCWLTIRGHDKDGGKVCTLKPLDNELCKLVHGLSLFGPDVRDGNVAAETEPLPRGLDDLVLSLVCEEPAVDRDADLANKRRA